MIATDVSCLSEGKESDDDDAEWFRQEVGEEPDPDLFQSMKAPSMHLRPRKRRQSGHQAPEAKKRKWSPLTKQIHKKTITGSAKGKRAGEAKRKIGRKGIVPVKTTVKLGRFFRTSSHKHRAM